MSKKEFENIDQLFKQELDLSDVKAPAHIKSGIDAKLDASKRKKWWLFLLIPVLAAVIIAVPLVGDNEGGSDNQGGENIASSNSSDDSGNNSDSDNNSSIDNSNDTDSNLATDQNDQNSTISSNDYSSHDNNSVRTNQTNSDISSNDSDHSNTNTDRSSTDFSNDNNSTDSNSRDTKDSNEDFRTNDADDNANLNDNSSSDQNTQDDRSDNNIIDNSNGDSLVDQTDANQDTDTDVSSTEIRTGNADSNEDNDNRVNEEVTVNNNSESENETADEINENSQPDEMTNKRDTTTNDEAHLSDSLDTAERTEQDSLQENDITEADTTFNEEIEPDIEIQKPKKEKFNHWFLTVHGGPKFKRSSLSVSDTSVVYDNALSDKIGYGVGMDVNYMLRNGLLFGSGIEYAGYTESYDYEKIQTILIDSTVSWNVFITDSIVDSVGTTYIYDSTSNVTYNYDDQEVFNHQGKNQTTYLHIPFRFGIQVMRKKWGFDAYLQGRFNLLLRTNATYVLNDQLVTSTLTGSYFDLELGGALHYNIWKNLYLSGVVRYRPPLRNPYYDPTFQNKMQYLYLGLGASINF